ncbi:DUF4870 domain-containing protein [Desulforamulus aquiferis]|uniref:DUF4870 domain-containing protein n=1 Tax=Desulforamulus aquiferis TaxID=1397668 RepID=A0AAW7Z8W7_9FIRM|nr:DUF4870 domain-containing protein [Desulforamulus aquiferis]MDO7785724.1 DUF4870 domain-containing protein [Desulforamulus aquiferis]
MSSGNQERTWAMFCHLGGFCGYFIPLGNIIVPLVLWLIKREEYPFVNEHGKEALNFNISMLIYAIVSAVLAFVLVGFLLIGILFIFHIVVIIKATMAANKGDYYSYPLTIRFL